MKFEKIVGNDKDEFIYEIKSEMTVLPFLVEALDHQSRNSVKSVLKRGQVSVNEIVTTQFDDALYPGDRVEILRNNAAKRKDRLVGLTILYEDHDLIVINKAAGLLSVSTGKGKELTAHKELMEYVRAKDASSRVFVVHRLDRDTSGVMMFAKNKYVKEQLQAAWDEMVTARKYHALVHGKVTQDSGYVSSWLKENKAFHVYSSQKKDDGLYAMTLFKVLAKKRDYSLLEVELKTGRKNQIRVHMQDLGHPIVGDKKYGGKGNPIKRLGLHAAELSFKHPKTSERMTFTAETPPVFKTLI